MLKTIQYIILIIISGLILPLVLIPIVQLTGYSEVIEEIAKVLIIFFLVLKLSTLKQKIWAGVLFGFLFGLSESLLYLNNIFQLGDFSVFWQRILLTVPMHVITVLIMILFAFKNKKWIVLGLACSIILHLGFNLRF